MVVFHREIRDRLLRQLHAGTHAQSLLFTGPEGVGKRSLARWYAQAVLCESLTAEGPCQTCEACRASLQSVHPDLTMATSARETLSIEEWRGLQARLLQTPLRSSYTVLIVPQAERLTLAAQHACLKTLEEPRHRAILLLTTASADALLPTMRSRLTSVRLPPIPLRVLQKAFTEAEGNLSSEEINHLIAYARGCPGKILREGILDPDIRATLERVKRMASLAGKPLWTVVPAVRALVNEHENIPDAVREAVVAGMQHAVHTSPIQENRSLWGALARSLAHTVHKDLALDALSLALAHTKV